MMEFFFSFFQRNVLRHEIFIVARLAVSVRPTVYVRDFARPVSVDVLDWRGPFKRIWSPWVLNRAFSVENAAEEVPQENNLEHIIDEVYERCKEQLELGVNEMKNFVRMIYQPFTAEQISAKIAELVRPSDCKAELQIIFQKIEDLHSACQNHRGDWYFSGNYPTPGGNKVVSKAFINYMEGINERAY